MEKIFFKEEGEEMKRLLGSALGIVAVVAIFGALSCAQLGLVKPQEWKVAPTHVKYGYEYPLAEGVVFIPRYLKIRGNEVDVLVHFHGAAWAIEEQLFRSKKRAVLVSVSYKGLSEAYRRPYEDREKFANLLDESLSKLREATGNYRLQWRRVGVSAFSAGYGAVREILKEPRYYAIITDLVFADSIHTGYTPDGAVEQDNLAPFLQFARDAAAGKKKMFLTHSEIEPKTYASTTETSNYLIQGVEGKRKPAHGTNRRKMKLLSRFDMGGMHVRGYAGNTAPDHMDHLYILSESYKRIF
jgi:hypothetical protein